VSAVQVTKADLPVPLCRLRGLALDGFQLGDVPVSFPRIFMAGDKL
jgi:hypothetical protein